MNTKDKIWDVEYCGRIIKNTECFYRGSERNKSSLGFSCSYDNMNGGGWLNFCSIGICKIKKGE